MIRQRARLLFAVFAAGIAFTQPSPALHLRAEGAKTQNAGWTRIDAGPSDSTLESRLLRDAADGQWNEHTLFASALIASGVATAAELNTAIDEFNLLAGELRSSLIRLHTGEARASFALSFLHRRLLYGGYDLQSTELPTVLASGRYNCVSATVLYNSLAAQADLTLAALRLPNHTCSLLLNGDQRTRVEATCADWFAARHRPRTGNHAETPPTVEERGAVEGRQISDVALVAMIYYNRGVEALRRGDYDQAIALNRRALRLDSHSSDARGNLLAAISKRALAHAAQGNFSAANAIVDEGLAIDANHATLRQNRLYINRARQTAVDVTSGDTL